MRRLRMNTGSPKGQRGATLIVGLIMIVLITLIVVNAFTMSSSNLKAVGNMQVRDEALAAANQAVEQVISADFTNPPTAQSINVDLNKDSVNDYTVEIAIPTCQRATVAATGKSSDVELGSSLTGGQLWYTEWEIDATVTDAATGAKVRTKQGVRVLLSDARKTAVCA